MSSGNEGRRKNRQITTGGVASSMVGLIFNVVAVAVVAMLVYRFSISAYQYGFRIFGEPAMDAAPGVDVEVTVADGQDFAAIAEELFSKGLVRDQRLFHLQEMLSNYSEEGFPEGSCILNTSMTPDEMIDALAQIETAETEEQGGQ